MGLNREYGMDVVTGGFGGVQDRKCVRWLCARVRVKGRWRMAKLKSDEVNVIAGTGFSEWVDGRKRKLRKKMANVRRAEAVLLMGKEVDGLCFGRWL